MEKEYRLAVDIGASSGRHIVGHIDDGKLVLEEVYRFKNGTTEKDGHLTWDTERLFEEVKNGLKAAIRKYKTITSMAIDTWAVDYVLMNGDTKTGPAYAYRDTRTGKITGEVHRIIPFEELYRRTGIQFQPFNTVYQLYCDKISGRLENATDFLMIPEYLSYRLTGIKAHEYTNASTTGLVSAETGEYDNEIISALGLPEKLFGRIEKSGTHLGRLLPEVKEDVGGDTDVLLCASHDTASAFEAVETAPDDIYLSSGTWSLIGAKIKHPITTAESMKANFTNEGGAGYIRYLKNITGMWINVKLSEESGLGFKELERLAGESSYSGIFDVNDPAFSSPRSMMEAISSWFIKKDETAPRTPGDYCRSAYLSLAHAYKAAADELEKLTGQPFKRLIITGGGAKNLLLNNFTEKYSGRTVCPLPIEATAIGNLKIQFGGQHVSI